SPEVYTLLLDEFKAEISVKKKSRTAEVKKEARETIALETIQVKDQAKEDLAKKKEEEKKEKEAAEAKAKADAEAAEVAEAKAKENERAEAEKKKDEPAKEEPKKVDEKPILKVLDKIDLNPVKPVKVVVEKKEETVKKEAIKEPVKEEPKKVEEKPKPKVDEIETVRMKPQILAGPKIMGKIDIPKPVASSSESTKTKRKRKRIDKPGAKPTTPSRPGARGNDRRGPKPKKRPGSVEYTPEQIQKEIKDTLAKLNSKGKSKGVKLRRQKRDEVAKRAADEDTMSEMEKAILKLTEFVTVSELASMMDLPATEIISACMSLGMLVSINQRIDAETITVIAEEFGYQVEFVSAEIQESIIEEVDDPADLEPRPPIVTVMGHVDHGKTSLLDYIRKENVISGEAGGITQHIGAYNVNLENGKKITFLDTPGHESFTAMRARGAQVTDVVIIVIAADDSVMPQTREAINHAMAAGVPMVFAFNKIDKPGINVDRIKEELSAMDILVEDWGGKFQSQDISAKNGTNISELMEKVMLEAELLELKANPNKRASGAIIESTLDKGRGYVTTLLVSGGTLRKGDVLVSGQTSGRVKALFNEKGKQVTEVLPGFPVSILGLDGATDAGDQFNVMENEKEARAIANKRSQLQREQSLRTTKHITLDEIGRRIALGEFSELNIIIKADVSGSLEALSDSLQKLSTEKVAVKIIHKGIGQISDSDVLLASASDAIIIGFQVRPSVTARALAEREEVQIKLYSIIYDVIDDVKDAMEGMLSAKIEEKTVGTVEVREIFKITRIGTIAGCFVLDGKITRNKPIRLIREGIVKYSGKLGSLKRFKDDVKEVTKGYECGLNIDGFNDIQVGDQIESYEEIEVQQTL
ncbi:MAG: translation initiation factor IF-2, partial [Patiriisocius sp.]